MSGRASTMIDMGMMYACELAFPTRFTNVLDTGYGKLFYNVDNPLSHDSNHGIVFRLDGDVDSAVEHLTEFYLDRGLQPRIYPGFCAGEVDILRPVLRRHGFEFLEYHNEYFVLGKARPAGVETGIEVRRVTEVDEGLVELLCATEGSDRTVRVLRRALRHPEFQCFVGYAEGRPVTMGTVDEWDGCSRVDNVLTHPDSRGRGYCRALIHALVEHCRGMSDSALYLWANNPAAIKIYREAGFEDVRVDRPSWIAWIDRVVAERAGKRSRGA